MPWIAPQSMARAHVLEARRRIATWIKHVGGDWGSAKGWTPLTTFAVVGEPADFEEPKGGEAVGPGCPRVFAVGLGEADEETQDETDKSGGNEVTVIDSSDVPVVYELSTNCG